MQSWSAIQLAVLKYLHLNNFRYFTYSMLIKVFRYFVVRASGLRLISYMKLGIIHVWHQPKYKEIWPTPPPLSQKIDLDQKCKRNTRLPFFLADITYERSFRYCKDIQSVKLAWSILHWELKASLMYLTLHIINVVNMIILLIPTMF